MRPQADQLAIGYLRAGVFIAVAELPASGLTKQPPSSLGMLEFTLGGREWRFLRATNE